MPGFKRSSRGSHGEEINNAIAHEMLFLAYGPSSKGALETSHILYNG
jgi:hypothetical protein